MRRTSHVVLKARQRELAQYGFSPVTSAVLFTVQAIGHDATPVEISRYLLREPHSVSALLSRMEREGLVGRVKDLARKNQVRIFLTEKGIEAYNKSYNRKSIHKIMSVLSEEEHQQMTSYLTRIQEKALKELR